MPLGVAHGCGKTPKAGQGRVSVLDALWLTYQHGLEFSQCQVLKSELGKAEFWGDRRQVRDWFKALPAVDQVFEVERPFASGDEDSEPAVIDQRHLGCSTDNAKQCLVWSAHVCLMCF